MIVIPEGNSSVLYRYCVGQMTVQQHIHSSYMYMYMSGKHVIPEGNSRVYRYCVGQMTVQQHIHSSYIYMYMSGKHVIPEGNSSV